MRVQNLFTEEEQIQIFNINVTNEDKELISICKLTTITLPK